MYAVITDTSANLDQQWLKDNRVEVIPFHYYVGGEDLTCTETRGFDGPSFYNAMRSGEKVTTSQITPQAYLDVFRPILSRGEDILFVSMSGGISGSYAESNIAAAELREEFPYRLIHLVDTYSASLGEGLLVVKAVECRDEGMPLEETFRLLQDLRHSMCQVFTVDDLKYLRNTGRVSNVKALVGTVLNIKPLLKGDPEGKIVNFENARGRKKALRAMAEQYDRYVRDADRQTIGIAHADCIEDVEALVTLLKENHPPKDILTVMYEPVTGSHVGPGTVALFFFGDPEFRGKSESILSALSQKVEDRKEAIRSSIEQFRNKRSR